MTNEERAAIREFLNFGVTPYIRKHKDGFKANIEFICDAVDHMNAMLDALEEAEADRDRWKARAEALERATKTFAACRLCAYDKGWRTNRACANCEHYSNWKFDEARFAGKDEGND